MNSKYEKFKGASQEQKQLLSAIETGCLQEVKKLVTSSVNPNFEINDGYAFSPIYLAISRGELDIALWLFEEGGVQATEKILEWAGSVIGDPSMANLVLSKLR